MRKRQLRLVSLVACLICSTAVIGQSTGSVSTRSGTDINRAPELTPARDIALMDSRSRVIGYLHRMGEADNGLQYRNGFVSVVVAYGDDLIELRANRESGLHFPELIQLHLTADCTGPAYVVVDELGDGIQQTDANPDAFFFQRAAFGNQELFRTTGATMEVDSLGSIQAPSDCIELPECPPDQDLCQYQYGLPKERPFHVQEFQQASGLERQLNRFQPPFHLEVQ